jgi:hypothetical protein
MRLARQPPLMAVCWEQEQPDGKAVTSSTSEVVSEITLNPEVMQIPPAPEESGYQNVAALVGSSATLPELTIQGFGSMPMRSFTADEIRWVQPR